MTRSSTVLRLARSKVDLVVLFLVLTGMGLNTEPVIAQEAGGNSDDIEVLRDLRYDPRPGQHWTLDLAQARLRSKQPRPVIVIIHGGGWIEGDKSSFSTLKQRNPASIIDFARLGFVAVTINYRLSKEAPFPAALHDCKCAIRWLRAHAQEYHIDPERIGAYGNSAGGHLALLLGMIDKQAGLEGDGPWQEYSSLVQAAASDSGPIDLIATFEHKTLRGVVEKFLAGPPEGSRVEEYKRASPSKLITKSVPPILLIYGVTDTQVPVETADRFVLALDQAGIKDVTYYRLAATGHCPHSIQRVTWLQPAVNEFFQRTLRLGAEKVSR